MSKYWRFILPSFFLPLPAFYLEVAFYKPRVTTQIQKPKVFRKKSLGQFPGRAQVRTRGSARRLEYSTHTSGAIAS